VKILTQSDIMAILKNHNCFQSTERAFAEYSFTPFTGRELNRFFCNSQREEHPARPIYIFMPLSTHLFSHWTIPLIPGDGLNDGVLLNGVLLNEESQFLNRVGWHFSKTFKIFFKIQDVSNKYFCAKKGSYKYSNYEKNSCNQKRKKPQYLKKIA
jgi:hypothetical protein